MSRGIEGNPESLPVPSSEKFDRRGFFKFTGLRVAETGFLLGVNVKAFIDLREKMTQRQENLADQVASDNEQGLSLQTHHFAEKIMYIANQDTTGKDENVLLGAIAGGFLGNFGMGWMTKERSERVRRGVGLASGVGANVADSLSTIAFAKYMEDPRFFEYGFSNFVGEINSELTEHPTRERVVDFSVKSFPVRALLYAIIPGFGRTYIGAVPFIVRNNTEAAHMLKRSFELGDIVQRHIDEGRSQEDIEEYLNSLVSQEMEEQPVDQNL